MRTANNSSRAKSFWALDFITLQLYLYITVLYIFAGLDLVGTEHKKEIKSTSHSVETKEEKQYEIETQILKAGLTNVTNCNKNIKFPRV